MAQWLEHCISSAKGCGFNSQGTHILIKKCIACKSLWIKASAKCIYVILFYFDQLVNLINIFLQLNPLERVKVLESDFVNQQEGASRSVKLH